MNSVSQVIISLLDKCENMEPLVRYKRMLMYASELYAPPFGNKEYRELYNSVAVDAEWMRSSMLNSSASEGEGARRLWSIASCTKNKVLADQVRRHAIDESRHSQWYIRALDIVFPNLLSYRERHLANMYSPRYSESCISSVDNLSFGHALTIDDVVQMNIAEIRTTIHHLLQRPVLLSHCKDSDKRRLVKILDAIFQDEVKHIAYTALIIEKTISQGKMNYDELFSLYCERLINFNTITINEISRMEFNIE